MESFYGGRQGASFVIKKKFKYLDPCDPAYLAKHDFISCYKNSSGTYVFTNLDGETTSDMPNRWDIMSVCLEDTGYQDVWYNEYCIIDTDNKNNPNNGKIFRRVLPNEDYVTPGYEHIGTIVGPSSGAAMLKPQSGLLKLGNIREELAKDNWDGLGILVKDELGNDKPVIYDPSFTSEDNIKKSQWPGDIEPKVYPIEIGKGLVHGLAQDENKKTRLEKTLKQDENTGKPYFENKILEKTDEIPEPVIDNIKYNWFNVRKNTDNNDGVVESWCYIGFEMPATSFTVEALHSTPGTQPQVYENEISQDHPFWYDLHFEIPGGLRGVGVEEIFVSEFDEDAYLDATNQAAEQIKAINENTLFSEEEKAERTQEIYNNLKEYIDTLTKPIKAYTFNQLNYDSPSDTYSIIGEQKSFSAKSWFCKLRIMNFNPTPKATTPIVLENTVFYIGPVVEIKHVDFNTETGHFEILYHNKKTNVWDIRYPKQFTFTTATDKIQTNGEEKEITYNTGKYDIDYSCGQDESGQFGFVRKVILQEGEGEDETKGSLTFVNTVGGHTQTYDFSYPKTLEFYKTDNLHDGRWKIDYYGAPDVEGQFGFVKSVSMSEGANNEKGIITFNNTISDETQNFDFSYPKTLTLTSETGEWEIDYFGAKTESGQLGYVKAAAIDSNKGTITFTNTIGDKTTVQDLIYVKDIDANADTGILTATYSNNTTEDFVQFDYPKSIEINQSTGEYDIDYSKSDNVTGQFGFVDKATIDSDNGTLTFRNTATGDDVQTFVYPKTMQMDTEGNVAYIDSKNVENPMGQLAFVDSVVVDDAHQLLIAYTDNDRVEPNPEREPVILNGKTYINYGQTIGTLGIMSGPMPEDATAKSTIDNIVNWFNTNPDHANGVVNGKVSGKLHVVTTEPLDGSDPISCFIAWNPDKGTWYKVSEIAGAPVGVPAQIGGTLTTGGQEKWTYADSEEMLADGAIRFVQLEEDEQPLTTTFPWM